MMTQQMTGKKVLILVANGVDEAAMSMVQREMIKTGATLKAVGMESGLVNSWNNNTWGLYFPVDQPLAQTLASDFDYLVVPSGSRGILKLAGSAHSERIVSSFIAAGKPMLFMGDAVELLAKTGLAKGMTVAGPERSHQVMVAAGAVWSADPECISGCLMTGEGSDVSSFVQKAIVHFAGSEEEPLKAAA